MRIADYMTRMVLTAGLAIVASCTGEGEKEWDCSGIDNRKEDCLIGAAFADCPGPINYTLFCEQFYNQGCVWISNGCPLEKYSAEMDSQCGCLDGSYCAGPAANMDNFVTARGKEPWDRNREMNVKVVFDPDLKPTFGASGCKNCSDACDDFPNTCYGSGVREYLYPGTFIARHESYFQTNDDKGWYIEIEIDLYRKEPVGRVCRIPRGKDEYCTRETISCAKDGTIFLENKFGPDALDDMKGHFGIYRAVFSDGMEISDYV